MIDFRYHLVSIVAIFLALTVGIVLGSTALEPMFYKSAEDTTAGLRKANESYIAQISELQSREEGGDSLVTTHLADLVHGQLAGERVVLVEAPGAPGGLREPIERLVTSAGGTYAGRVSLTDKFTAGDQAAIVDGLATSLAPIGMRFSAEASPYDKAAAMLSTAIVTNDRTKVGRLNADASRVLESFQGGGFLSLSGSPEERSSMAIVLAPSQPYEGDDAERQTAAIVSVAAGLDAVDFGTVLTGSTTASASGGAIAALRDTGEAASSVSTVDTVDFAAGRVVVVYALREQLTGRSGSYGVGSGASAFEPTVVAPSASPTPSPAASSG
ncbi:copper transporter [Microbispora sp. NPDC049125]|uniref:copper transporter n=1 Tax=Microbispora sp. NPDC049125 TaxID=3154929 RepID=UPI0034659E43